MILGAVPELNIFPGWLIVDLGVLLIDVSVFPELAGAASLSLVEHLEPRADVPCLAGV